MKSLKKTLVLLVVLSMIFSTLVPAFAATDVADLDCEDAVLRMEALEIIKGYEDGTFKPENTITRAEMAVIICKMTGITEAAAEASKNVDTKFSDVKAGDWYTGYINLAAGNGIIAGFPDGTFRPNEVLTLNQVLTLCVKALGRGGYVDQMGTWPANYVTEAARLNLLKNVKGASSANRGNVAIICWNTLNTATWYVDSETLDGEVTLGDGHANKTLLSIHYSDFATEEAGAFKEITGLEIAAENIADSDTQLLLDADLIETDDEVPFAHEFAKEPTKNKDEKSFKTKDGDEVYIYVPEEICEDLDELVGKTITIILGEDNVVALLLVEDDIQGDDVLVAYENGAKEKITIGGTKYTMADKGYTVELNDTAVTADANTTETALEKALKLIGVVEADYKDIEKVIEATVMLDSDDDVKSISLKTSATIKGYSVETVVEKVKETSSTYKITTAAGEISWSLDAEEEDDIEFPKVYVDGVKGEIRDIAAGNVLTIYTTVETNPLADVELLDKIYVSTKTVAGEPSRITKAENAVRLDDTYYAPSFAVVDGTTVCMTTEELKDGDWDKFDSEKILKNDEVTLYLNVYGEYVAVALEDVATDYIFGVTTYVASQMTTSGDEEEYQEAKFRVLLPDGTKKYFSLSLDTSDEDLVEDLEKVQVYDVIDVLNIKVGDFVMFEANADGKVEVENNTPITVLEADSNVVDDYVIAVLDGTIDDGEFTAKTADGQVTIADAEYDEDETVIFNLKGKEIASKWESILDDKEETFKAANTFMVFEDKDADVPMFIVTETDYTASDAEYAIAGEEGVYQDKNDETKFYADLEGKDDLIEFTSGANREILAGWLVEFAMSSSKVADTFSILNVEELYDEDTKYDLTTVAEVIDLGARKEKTPETKLLKDIKAETLEAIQLNKVSVKSNDDYKLEFVEIEDEKISNISVSEDVVVLEVSYADNAAAVAEIDMSELMTRVNEDGEDICAIPCYRGTDDSEDNILFVFSI